MTRQFRGSTYQIEVTVGAGAAQVTVDGRPFDGQIIPAFGDGREHVVTVRLPGS